MHHVPQRKGQEEVPFVGASHGPARSTASLCRQPLLCRTDCLPRIAAQAIEPPAGIGEGEMICVADYVEFSPIEGLYPRLRPRPGRIGGDRGRAPAVAQIVDKDAACAFVFERMIFDMNREAFVAGNETRPFGDRPTLQDAVEFESKMIMPPTGSVFLDD